MAMAVAAALHAAALKQDFIRKKRNQLRVSLAGNAAPAFRALLQIANASGSDRRQASPPLGGVEQSQLTCASFALFLASHHWFPNFDHLYLLFARYDVKRSGRVDLATFQRILVGTADDTGSPLSPLSVAERLEEQKALVSSVVAMWLLEMEFEVYIQSALQECVTELCRLANLRSTSEAIEFAFGLFDHQRQGSFSCDEFVAAMRQCLPHEDGDEAWVALFSRLDADADGIFTIGQWISMCTDVASSDFKLNLAAELDFLASSSPGMWRMPSRFATSPALPIDMNQPMLQSSASSLRGGVHADSFLEIKQQFADAFASPQLPTAHQPLAAVTRKSPQPIIIVKHITDAQTQTSIDVRSSHHSASPATAKVAVTSVLQSSNISSSSPIRTSSCHELSNSPFEARRSGPMAVELHMNDLSTPALDRRAKHRVGSDESVNGAVDENGNDLFAEAFTAIDSAPRTPSRPMSASHRLFQDAAAESARSHTHARTHGDRGNEPRMLSSLFQTHQSSMEIDANLTMQRSRMHGAQKRDDTIDLKSASAKMLPPQADSGPPPLSAHINHGFTSASPHLSRLPHETAAEYDAYIQRMLVIEDELRKLTPNHVHSKQAFASPLFHTRHSPLPLQHEIPGSFAAATYPSPNSACTPDHRERTYLHALAQLHVMQGEAQAYGASLRGSPVSPPHSSPPPLLSSANPFKSPTASLAALHGTATKQSPILMHSSPAPTLSLASISALLPVYRNRLAPLPLDDISKSSLTEEAALVSFFTTQIMLDSAATATVRAAAAVPGFSLSRLFAALVGASASPSDSASVAVDAGQLASFFHAHGLPCLRKEALLFVRRATLRTASAAATVAVSEHTGHAAAVADARSVQSRDVLSFTDLVAGVIPADAKAIDMLRVCERERLAHAARGWKADEASRNVLARPLHELVAIAVLHEYARQNLTRRPAFNFLTAFECMNTAGRGRVTPDDISRFYRARVPGARSRDAALLVARFDRNADASISYSEFVRELVPV